MRITYADIACGLLAVAICTMFSPPVHADCGGDGKQDEFPRPLVIGHRDAHGYPPAHTLEGYSLAINGKFRVSPDQPNERE